MRAAAVALVLILGAAVVLWYANMLNSWVLGGLIGGLAALLISIPISLTLFSYLSHRHEEQLRLEAEAEAEEEMYLAQESYYIEGAVEAYESDAYDGYMLPAGETEGVWQEEESDYRPAPPRNLPARMPSYPRLPAVRQPTSEKLVPRQRTTEYPLMPQERPTKAASPPGREAPVRRPTAASTQQMRYPGFPGYQTGAMRSFHQTAALHAARQEAARQQHSDSETEVWPTNAPGSRKLPGVRSEQNMPAQNGRPMQPGGPRTSRQLQPPPNHYRTGRTGQTVEGSSLSPFNQVNQGNRGSRALPAAGESSANRGGRGPQGRYPEDYEAQTDQLGGRYPETGPIQPRRQQPQQRQQKQQQQTGQMARHPRVDPQRRNPDVVSGSLKNPMVRRAPYMYEDDPIRQEFSQYIEAPAVRRSSRYEEYEDEQED